MEIIFYLLVYLIIGGISGWLAGVLWKGNGFGLIGNIVIGIIGGLFGGWLAGKLGIFGDGLFFKILVAAGGAWVLLFLIALVKER